MENNDILLLDNYVDYKIQYEKFTINYYIGIFCFYNNKELWRHVYTDYTIAHSQS